MGILQDVIVVAKKLGEAMERLDAAQAQKQRLQESLAQAQMQIDEEQAVVQATRAELRTLASTL